MDKLTYKYDDKWCISGINGKLISDKHANYWGEAIDRLAYYEDLEEQGRLIILPTKEEVNNSRCCKTCYANDMGWDEIDCPCWNCKGDHSEWMPKNN